MPGVATRYVVVFFFSFFADCRVAYVCIICKLSERIIPRRRTECIRIFFPLTFKRREVEKNKRERKKCRVKIVRAFERSSFVNCWEKKKKLRVRSYYTNDREVYSCRAYGRRSSSGFARFEGSQNNRFKNC